jgi:hypothetical protein
LSIAAACPRFLASRLVLRESRADNEPTEGAPMDIVPLGPGFAAELRGVTLAEIAADDTAYAAARAAFEQHSVWSFAASR